MSLNSGLNLGWILSLRVDYMQPIVGYPHLTFAGYPKSLYN